MSEEPKNIFQNLAKNRVAWVALLAFCCAIVSCIKNREQFTWGIQETWKVGLRLAGADSLAGKIETQQLIAEANRRNNNFFRNVGCPETGYVYSIESTKEAFLSLSSYTSVINNNDAGRAQELIDEVEQCSRSLDKIISKLAGQGIGYPQALSNFHSDLNHPFAVRKLYSRLDKGVLEQGDGDYSKQNELLKTAAEDAIALHYKLKKIAEDFEVPANATGLEGDMQLAVDLYNQANRAYKDKNLYWLPNSAPNFAPPALGK